MFRREANGALSNVRRERRRSEGWIGISFEPLALRQRRAASRTAEILTRAIRVAVARRGVAVIVIPAGVALKPLNIAVPKWLIPSKPVVRPCDEDLHRLASLLNEGARVSIPPPWAALWCDGQIVSLRS